MTKDLIQKQLGEWEPCGRRAPSSGWLPGVEFCQPPPNEITMNTTNADIPSTQAAAPDTPVSGPSAGSTQFTVETIVSDRKMDAHSSAAAFVSKPNVVHEIAQYLEKPVQLRSGVWDIVDPAAAALYSVTDVWASLYNQDVWARKLKGFLALRATLVVELKLNATPFQQGRLKLSYYPMGQRAPNKVSSHLGHRIPISQLPGIEISTAQESVTLRIPYITPARYIELTSQTAIGWGSLFLHVMCPLSAGASNPSSTVGWSVWCHLEDVELLGQTDQDLVAPQSGLNISSKRVPPGEREGPMVSSTLRAAGALAGQLGRIPSLGAAAGTAQWALNAGANAAAALGFSRPATNGMTIVARDPLHYGATADGHDVAMPMSVLSDAKLVTLPGLSPSGEDEMSMEFVGRQWSYFTEFGMTTSNIAGDVLGTLNTAPRFLRFTVGPNERYLSPVAYLAMMHHWHHGGLEYMFKLVKTGFHTGTLSFTFVPGMITVAPTLASMPYCYRNIVDLQKGSSVCLELPWMVPIDYLKTDIGHGTLYVHVINPLRAPETVAQSITIQVYVRAAKDKQWLAPINADGPTVVSPQSGAVAPQGGDTLTLGEAICEVVGGAPSNALDVSIAAESGSEMALSLRQYAKRYMRADTNFTAGALAVGINPYVFGARTPAAMPTAVFYCSRFSLLASPFAFARGGLRFRIISQGNPAVKVSPINLDVFAVNSISIDNHATRAAEFVNVQVPYTALGRFTPVEWQSGTTLAVTTPNWWPTRGFNLQSIASTPLTDAIGTCVYQLAGSDDFECFYFVGIPRLTNGETFY